MELRGRLGKGEGEGMREGLRMGEGREMREEMGLNKGEDVQLCFNVSND